MTTNPPSANAIYYDSNNPALWNNNGTTGVNGVAWIPGIPIAPSPSRETVTPPAPAVAAIANIAVENGAITFVTQDIP